MRKLRLAIGAIGAAAGVVAFSLFGLPWYLIGAFALPWGCFCGWVTAPLSVPRWHPPPLRPGDELLEAHLHYADGRVEPIVLRLRRTAPGLGDVEGFDRPLVFGPDIELVIDIHP